MELNSNADLSTTPIVTCATDPSYIITYSLEQLDGAEVPSWVSIDRLSGVLTGRASSVSKDTTYKFR